jgi:hypothetical protein
MPTRAEHRQEARRLSEKSLRHLLCQRFLHQYGFSGGRMIVPVIVDDILRLVAAYYGDARGPQQIVYTAADAQATLRGGRRIADTPLQPVHLTMIADHDTAKYAQGAVPLLTARLVRWTHEAYDQGALLTTADLAFLSGHSARTVERHLCRHELTTQSLLPLRGTIHDCSPKLTHKRLIVERYLAGELPTEIARQTHHSIEAVERYLRDFILVRAFADRFDAEQISHLVGRGIRVIQQYLELLNETSPSAKRDTPVRRASVSPQSGSHEPAGETLP